MTKPADQAQTPTQKASSGKYPLELVANLAARLLQSENYSQAVKRAIALLDETTTTLEGRAVPPPPKPLALPEPTDMGWGEFVKYLTDGERRDRAESKVDDYFKFEIKIRKAEQLAEERLGTLSGRGQWREFIHQVPETSAQELRTVKIDREWF
jgi:hypothetical protein